MEEGFVVGLAGFVVVRQGFKFGSAIVTRGTDCLLIMIGPGSEPVEFQLESLLHSYSELGWMLLELEGLRKRFVMVDFVDLLLILDSLMLLRFEIGLGD